VIAADTNLVVRHLVQDDVAQAAIGWIPRLSGRRRGAPGGRFFDPYLRSQARARSRIHARAVIASCGVRTTFLA
jgi:hypothetical protein